MGENMNVLYISNLTGNLFAGPNNSSILHKLKHSLKGIMFFGII